MKKLVLILMMAFAMTTQLMADDVVPKATIHLRNGQMLEGVIKSRTEQQVEQGRHDELIALGGTYKHLVDMQTF